MGGLREVNAQDDNEEVIAFLEDSSNDAKLMVIDESVDLKEYKIPMVMAINNRVAEYVLANSPSLQDLYHYCNDEVDNVLDSAEQAQLNRWMCLAAQTQDAGKKKPSSLLAHGFNVVALPSEELSEQMNDKLKASLGEVRVVTPDGKELPTSTTLAEKQLEDKKAKLEEVRKKLAAPKDKITDMAKARICGFSGQSCWEDCSIGWTELKHETNEDAAQLIEERLKLVAKEHNLCRPQQFVHTEMTKNIKTGKWAPCNNTVPLARYVHDVVGHSVFLPWTEAEKGDYMTEMEAQTESAPNRTLNKARRLVTESRCLQGKQAMPAPCSYMAICNVVEAFLVFCIGYFTRNSPLTKDMYELHDVLVSLSNESHNVDEQSWRNLSYILYCNEVQFYSIKTSASDVYDRVRLPVSMLRSSNLLTTLRTELKVNKVNGTPDHWLEKPKRKKERYERRDANQE